MQLAFVQRRWQHQRQLPENGAIGWILSRQTLWPCGRKGCEAETVYCAPEALPDASKVLYRQMIAAEDVVISINSQCFGIFRPRSNACIEGL